MHWRYIKAALVCGLLGFAGQCVGDFFCWSMDGLTPYQFSMVMNAQQVGLVQYSQADQQQSKQLMSQLALLIWVRDRAKLAGRTTALAAFLGVSTRLAADQLRERRKAQRDATVS